MKLSNIFKRLLREREIMSECGEFEPAPPPAPAPPPSYPWPNGLGCQTEFVISEFKQKSDPRQPPNAQLMISLLGREAAASSPLTYIDDRHPSKYDSVPPPVSLAWGDGCGAGDGESFSPNVVAHLISIRKYIKTQASKGDPEAVRLARAVDSMSEEFK